MFVFYDNSNFEFTNFEIYHRFVESEQFLYNFTSRYYVFNMVIHH